MTDTIDHSVKVDLKLDKVDLKEFNKSLASAIDHIEAPEAGLLIKPKIKIDDKSFTDAKARISSITKDIDKATKSLVNDDDRYKPTSDKDPLKAYKGRTKKQLEGLKAIYTELSDFYKVNSYKNEKIKNEFIEGKGLANALIKKEISQKDIDRSTSKQKALLRYYSETALRQERISKIIAKLSKAGVTHVPTVSDDGKTTGVETLQRGAVESHEARAKLDDSKRATKSLINNSDTIKEERKEVARLAREQRKLRDDYAAAAKGQEETSADAKVRKQKFNDLKNNGGLEALSQAKITGADRLSDLKKIKRLELSKLTTDGVGAEERSKRTDFLDKKIAQQERLNKEVATSITNKLKAEGIDAKAHSAYKNQLLEKLRLIQQFKAQGKKQGGLVQQPTKLAAQEALDVGKNRLGTLHKLRNVSEDLLALGGASEEQKLSGLKKLDERIARQRLLNAELSKELTLRKKAGGSEVSKGKTPEETYASQVRNVKRLADEAKLISKEKTSSPEEHFRNLKQAEKHQINAQRAAEKSFNDQSSRNSELAEKASKADKKRLADARSLLAVQSKLTEEYKEQVKVASIKLKPKDDPLKYSATQELGREHLNAVGGVGNIRSLSRDKAATVEDYLKAKKVRISKQIDDLAVLRKQARAEGGENSEDFKKYSREADKAEASKSKLIEGLKITKEKLSGFRSVMEQAGATMRLFFRYAIGYGALYQMLSAVTALVKGLVELDKQLHSIKAISGATSEEMIEISAAIKSVAVETQFNLAQIAEAAQSLAQAGVRPEDMATTLNNVALLASATNSTLKVSADLVSTMRNVFTDLNDRTIADQLTKAVNISKLTTEDLGTILSRGLQVSKAYNITSDQFLAAVTVLKNAGVKASTVATGLRQSILELMSPDAKTLKALRVRYRQMGEELNEEAIKARFAGFANTANPLLSVLQEMKRLGADGSGKGVFDRIFDVRAQNVINVLLKDLSKLDENLAKIGTPGAAADGARTQMESLSHSTSNLGASILNLSDTISGDFVGSLAEGVTAMTEFLKSAEELSTSFKADTGAGFGSSVFLGGAAGLKAFTGSQASIPRRLAYAATAATATTAGALGVQSAAPQTGEVISSLVDVLTGAGIISALGGFDKISSLAGKLSKAKKANGGKGIVGEAVKKASSTGATITKYITGITSKITSFSSLLSVFWVGLRGLLGPIGLLITAFTIGLSAFKLFYQDSEALSVKLKARQDQLAKLEKDSAEAGQALDQFDKTIEGSLAEKIYAQKDILEAYNEKVAKALGISESEVSGIQGYLDTLANKGIDLKSDPAKEAVKGITGEIGQEITPEVLRELSKLSLNKKTAVASLKAYAEEQLKFVQQTADKYSELTEVEKLRFDAAAESLAKLKSSDPISTVSNALISFVDKIAGSDIADSKVALVRAKLASVAETYVESLLAKKGAERVGAQQGLKELAQSPNDTRRAYVDQILIQLNKNLSTQEKSFFSSNSDIAALIGAIQRVSEGRELSDNLREGSREQFRSDTDSLNSEILKLVNRADKEPAIADIIKGVLYETQKDGSRNPIQVSDDQILSGTDGGLKYDYDANVIVKRLKESRAAVDQYDTAIKAAEGVYVTSRDLQLKMIAADEDIYRAKVENRPEDQVDLLRAKQRLEIEDKEANIAHTRLLEEEAGAQKAIALRSRIGKLENARADLIKKHSIALETAQRAYDVSQLSDAMKFLGQAVTSTGFQLEDTDVTTDLEAYSELLEDQLALKEEKIRLERISLEIQGKLTGAEIKRLDLELEGLQRAQDDKLIKAQNTANNAAIRDSKRLSEDRLRNKAIGRPDSKAEEISDLQRDATNAANTIALKESQQGSLKGDDLRKNLEQVKDLKETLIGLDEQLHNITRTLSEEVLDGLSIDTLSRKFDDLVRSTKDLSEALSDNLVGAVDSVGDALADAIVDGKDFLGTVREILYETARSAAKDGIKALYNQTVQSALNGLGSLFPGGSPSSTGGASGSGGGGVLQKLFNPKIGQTPEDKFAKAVDKFAACVCGAKGAVQEGGFNTEDGLFEETPEEEGIFSKVKNYLFGSGEEKGSDTGMVGPTLPDTVATEGEQGFFSGVWSSISRGFSSVFSTGSSIYESATNMFSDLFSGDSSIGTTIAGFFSSMFSGSSSGAGGGGGGLIASLMGAFSGGGGGSAGTAGALGGGFSSMAMASGNPYLMAAGVAADVIFASEGGIVSGKGTSTSDEIPAMLSNGEAVLNAKAVKAMGEGNINSINKGAMVGQNLNAVVTGSNSIQPNQPNIPTPEVLNSTRILNILDPDLAQDFMESSAGERVIVNAIKRNTAAVKQIIT